MKLFSFLSLLDKDGKLSITNLAVYLALIKFMVMPGDMGSVIGLLLTLISYGHKRHLNSKAIDASAAAAAKLEGSINEIKTRLSNAEMAVGVAKQRLGLKI